MDSSQKALMIFRVDVAPESGMGHLMRCLALAQSWAQENGVATFLLSDQLPAVLEQRIRADGFSLRYLPAESSLAADAAATSGLIRELDCAWVVLDGYQFDSEYQQRLKRPGCRILVFDDYGHAQQYYADLILNQNITANASLYEHRESYTRLLLGTDFAVLRKEFGEWRAWRREIPDRARRLLVTLGGSDPHNVTEKVLQAFEKMDSNLDVTVVVGASQRLCLERTFSGQKIRFVHAPSNMSELMADADIGISAAGSTAWELCFMGLPALVITVAENQRGIAPALANAGAAIDLGWADPLNTASILDPLQALIASASERARLSKNGRTLVDSLGSQRIVQAMAGTRFLYLREASMDDSQMIWSWANDAVTREASFSSAPIPWETHSAWFSRKLTDPQHVMLIALSDSMEPLGQVRYQIQGNEADISINLAPERRGAGYGSRILKLADKWLFRKDVVKTIHAYIKPDNLASKKAFTKAGYVYRETTIVDSISAEHYVVKVA
jgi:UDP-2,4-diacetamido-2,4,6-trideoxy-beta-L-altropyranose hydrolase